MSILVWSAIWAVVAYVVVNNYQNKYPDLNVSPGLYAVGSFFIGILWTMLFFAYKLHEHKKYNKYSR